MIADVEREIVEAPAAAAIPPEVMVELQMAADQASRGVANPTAARKACERMDRMREVNRQRFGVQNIGVEIVRDMRDSR